MFTSMWGRVENWAKLETAFARINVVWSVASLRAALGDILPGESSGEVIYEDIGNLGGFLERDENGNAGGE